MQTPKETEGRALLFFPDSVTLAARPGVCFPSADVGGRAFGWPLCGLWSEWLAGAVWVGKFGTEAAQARA